MTQNTHFVSSDKCFFAVLWLSTTSKIPGCPVTLGVCLVLSELNGNDLMGEIAVALCHLAKWLCPQIILWVSSFHCWLTRLRFCWYLLLLVCINKLNEFQLHTEQDIIPLWVIQKRHSFKSRIQVRTQYMAMESFFVTTSSWYQEVKSSLMASLMLFVRRLSFSASANVWKNIFMESGSKIPRVGYFLRWLSQLDCGRLQAPLPVPLSLKSHHLKAWTVWHLDSPEILHIWLAAVQWTALALGQSHDAII